MSEKLNTNWFKLENYEAFRTMSVQEWASQLEVRAYCFNAEEEEFRWAMPEMAKALKKGVLETDETIEILRNEMAEKALKSQPFSTSKVDSLKNHQAWEMTTINRTNTNATTDFQSMRDEWLKPWEDDEENRGDLLEAAHAPYDLHFKQYLGWNYISSLAHVTVDLNGFDEQIEADFSHWLLHYRTVTGNYVPKKKTNEKIFTQEDFDVWINDSLVPYLDLILIAKIEGKSITQEVIGELIFPDDDDRTWDISHKIKPDAEDLIKKENLSLLVNQATSVLRKRQNTKRYKYIKN